MAPIPSGDRLWRWGLWVPESGPPARSAELTFDLVLLQFNVCGSNCNAGGLGAPMDALSDAILTSRPHLVLLNEVCLAQADRLWELLDNAGYPMSGACAATTGSSKCPGEPGECWYGNAVFSAGPGVGEPEVIQLPNRPRVREERSAVSMVAGGLGRPVRVSSAHLIPPGYDREMNLLQMQKLAAAHHRWADAGMAVVFGGDFNLPPEQIRGIYEPEGNFAEVDFAHNRRSYRANKIDFIFLDKQSFYGLSAETKKSSFSDHKQLWGKARLFG